MDSLSIFLDINTEETHWRRNWREKKHAVQGLFQSFSIPLIFVICRLLCGSNIYACLCIYFRDLFFGLVYVYFVANCIQESFTNGVGLESLFSYS